MNKTMMKSILTATMLFSVVLGNGAITSAATVKPAATAKPTATPLPIMRDNLSKYGLKKDIELPVTVTAGGLSYTLEKIMIYDFNSKDAQGLIKKYDYQGTGKYFIWTKITVENKSKDTIRQNVTDLSEKWRLLFGDEPTAPAMPKASYYKPNSKEAVWDWSLAPGQKLSTYQAYIYRGNFNWFYIKAKYKGASESKYIVNRPVE
ncbi:hypothetical protein [Paenibacillus sp. FSL K6-2859]|uniref:hypothetical protein n=1 Tax=Paenibacillus sp. FSL K6-2859 TaxID=2921482 RepID=UPI0030FBB8BB